MLFRRSIVLTAVLLVSSFSFGTTPQVTGTTPTSGPTGTQVQINGSGFGATQGASAVNFNGAYPATIVSWSDTQIVATVPPQAFTGQVVVVVGGVWSNQSVYFNVPPPQITSISPTGGGVGTQVTVNGSGFQATKGGNSSVSFNGVPGTIVTWSNTQIVATVPANATTGAVKVGVNSIVSNLDQVFTMPNPIVSGLAPSTGPVGTAVQISGSGFGASQGTSTVQFNGVNATATAWNDSSITATVPTAATSGVVLVSVGGVTTSSDVKFTIPPPQITSISPTGGPANTQVTVTGSGFQSVKGTSVLQFNGSNAATTSWTDTQIVANFPSGISTGPVSVSVNGVSSNRDVVFTVPNPVVTSISPSSGPVGTQLTVVGTGFGSTQGTSTLKFEGLAATIVSWSDTQIVATVPPSATTGYILVTVNNVSNHAGDVNFTIPPAHISSISPSTGVGGTQVTITGTGFRSTQTAGGNTSSLSVNGFGVSIVSWSDTQIVANLAAGTTTGPVSLTGMAGNSNTDVIFTTPNPIVSSITPSIAGAGAQVQINGSGFGATQGSSTVTFNFNHPASIVSWSDTQIVAAVPAVAQSGAVKVNVGGVASNGNINVTIPPPVVTGISPTSGVIGTQVTISGTGFQGTQGSNGVFIGNSALTVNSWSDTQIVATIPASAVTSYVRVVVNIESNDDIRFTLPNPVIAGFTPSGGAIGTSVQISGSGFGSVQGTSTAVIGTTNLTVATWSDNLITGTVATGTSTGGVKVTVGGVASTSANFSVANLFVNGFSPLAGPANASVTVTGNGFGSSQGSSTISFNNVAATTISSWTDGQIVALVPATATSGQIKVTVNSASSNSATSFNVGSVVVNSVSPSSGLSGTQIQIHGSGFGATQGSSVATINGWSAPIVTWTDTLITATVPTQATTGAVRVVLGGGASSNTTVTFNMPSQVITSISPAKGPGGTAVTINGSGFGATQGNSSVGFPGGNLTVATWSDTVITGTVPSLASTGAFRVINGSVGSNSNVFFTVPVAQITSISPASGTVGTQVTINGSAFRSSQGSGSVSFNGTSASIVTWTDTQVVANVLAGSRTGPVTANVNGFVSNQDVIFSMPNPVVTSLSPTAGPTGTSVQISGSGFGATQGSSTLTFHGAAATVTSWSDNLIAASVPVTASSGVVAVSVGGVSSNSPINYTVPAPQVVSILPNRGTIGAQVTITGTGFQAAKGNNNLFFNGAVAPIVSWSDTQIVATIPGNASTGGIWATVNGTTSNSDIEFALFNPQITGLVPASGPVGTQVQINGSGFGAIQGGSTVIFSGFTATVASWSDAQIVVAVPASAASGVVKVQLSGGINSNSNFNFTVPVPRITSISPATGTVGTTVIINGSGFQAAKGNSYVSFNNTLTSTAVSWSDTQIVVTVPANATSGALRVIANNGDSSNQNFAFTMPNPIVTGLVPASGPTGTQVQINGSGFGATQGGNTVTFNTIAASVVSWSDTQITAIVPYTATSGPVSIFEGGVTSNMGIDFNVPAPQITSISPAIGGVGNPITINGTGFQAVRGSPTSYYVGFSGSGGTAAIKSWSDTQIVAVVPTGTTTGFLNININGTSSNYVNYTIPSQTISSLSPNTGPVGTQVTVNGTAFGSSQGTSVLSFNGQPATVSSWTNSQIIATVPVTSAAGPAVVTIGGVNSNAVLFTVPPPFVGNFLPAGGVSGTQITINGTGFQPTQRDSTLAFNGTPATVSSWSNTQIIATVPASATTGPLVVTVNGAPSPGVSFEVPHPTVTGITPAEAPANGVVTINGSGFGASDRYSPDGVSITFVGFINFNGVTVGALSWSDTSITTRIPSNGTSGPVTVLKYDATSNGVPITIEGAPTVTGLAPSVGPIGESVIISGSGFGPTQGASAVQFNGVSATVSAWSDTQITANVPPGAATGPVSVTVATVSGPTSPFTVNTSVQIVDSLGHSSSYTSAMIGGSWVGTDATGSGCTSCTLRGTIHDDYDPATGDLTAHTDELGRITNNAYDANSNLTSTTVHLDPSTPVQTTYTYNSFGEPLTVTDPLGNVTTNTYDANGNLLTVTSPVPATGVSASVTQFAYDTKGELTQVTDPLSHSTTLAYYPTGLIHTITDAQSNVTSYEYDSRGNRTAVVDAQSNRTTFAYDAANRLTGITYPDSTSVSFAYDSRGRRTSVTDQNGKVTSYAYDDADRLISTTDAALNVTTYAYDLENNLTSITDAASHTTSFVYDAFGRVTQTAFPSSLTENYVYDAIGNLTSKTDRKNQTILYVYDALNRLSHKGYPDATGVDYVYDLAGKIKQVTDPTGSYGFAYDNMGRPIGTTTQYAFLPGNTYTNSYGYDAASHRTSFTAPDGSTNAYAYDTLGRLSTLTNSLTGQFGYSYDSLSRRTALNRPNGVNTSYSYDSVSRLLNVLHKAGTVTLDGAGYTYDNAGNRSVKTNYLNNITENYTYDPTYQLTQVTQGTTATESYSYDAVGNRLSSLGMSPYAYNSSNELTSTPSATFTYDGNGNTLTKVDSSGTTTYNWDFANRLASIVLPASAGTVAFKYDPFGRRIQKSSSNATTNYLYDGANSIEEMDATGILLARYTQGGGVDEPIAELRSGTAGYYQQDGLGSVTSVAGATGTLLNSDIYDAFGNTTASTGSFANPFQYTGRDLDSETGLHYYRARYYDAAAGRFLSEDPLHFNGGGENFYRYVNNEPTNFIDPTGLTAQCPRGHCRVIVRCRGIESYHLGLLGAEHCDTRVWDSNGTEHSLSGGPDEKGQLNAWNTTQQSQGGRPLDPFTGNIIYYDGQANCDTADCLINHTIGYNAQPNHPKYRPVGGPNSNVWLGWTFSGCGIDLGVNWFGGPIFSLPHWRGK